MVFNDVFVKLTEDVATNTLSNVEMMSLWIYYQAQITNPHLCRKFCQKQKYANINSTGAFSYVLKIHKQFMVSCGNKREWILQFPLNKLGANFSEWNLKL